MSVRKRFDKELYQKYDSLAKQATKQFLNEKGCTVDPHPNRYAQDLVVKSDTEEFCAECEVKLVWKTDQFPYDNVQLPARKKKFFDVPTQFFIWNHTLNRAATFWSEDIKDLEPVEVPNKYVYKGEYFYQIPLDMVTFVTIEHSMKLP